MKALVNMCGYFERYKIPLIVFVISKALIFFVLILITTHDLGRASLNRWDSLHYVSIAQNGYQVTKDYSGEGSLIAFFPLFPIIIWLTQSITGTDYQHAGALIANIFALLSFILLYRVVFEWKGKEVAVIAVTLLAFSPSAVFLASSYTESLFLFLVLLTFYYLRKDSLPNATVTVALTCVTRITGSVLGAVFAWNVWRKTRSVYKTLLYGFLALIPFLTYLYFQYIQYGTPFAFLVAQKSHWLHHAVFPWRGLYIFLISALYDTEFPAMWKTDFVMLSIMVVTLGLSFKKIPRDIWLFGFGVVVLTLSSSYILGMSRYMMLVLPFYFYWGEYLSMRKFTFAIVLAVSTGWMVVHTILFSLAKYVL